MRWRTSMAVWTGMRLERTYHRACASAWGSCATKTSRPLSPIPTRPVALRLMSTSSR